MKKLKIMHIYFQKSIYMKSWSRQSAFDNIYANTKFVDGKNKSSKIKMSKKWVSTLMHGLKTKEYLLD